VKTLGTMNMGLKMKDRMVKHVLLGMDTSKSQKREWRGKKEGEYG
jgi:hypothetical protein